MNAVQKIAETLGEAETGPLRTIERVVTVLGEERALILLEQTQQIEVEGAGLLTNDGSQRRTPGGVFFKLAKNQTTSKERWAIFGPTRTAVTPKAKPQPLTWEEGAALINEILKSPKREATVKLTLIGRPGRVIEKDDVVITSVQSGKIPSLPKELPPPPAEPTTYVVYIARKQWNKVKESLKHPDDKLIIEGFPVFDKRIGQMGTMTVYAQSTTTKLLEQAKREQQKAMVHK
ncbi:MAG: hypothetical protein KJ077_22230 [Anaerolineae bacterium]|nr:hypothetical protein [Anaerolineae bacterium]